jgi:hypothetical protein
MGLSGLMGRALILGGLIASWPAAADDDCSKLQDSWNRSFRDTYHVAWEAKEFTCENSLGKLALTLNDLESLTFTPTSSGYRPDFSSIVTRNLRSLKYDLSCTVYLATGDRATGTITLCPAFFEDSREDRASTLVHEARHLERGDPGHVTCAGGAHSGDVKACDQDFHDGTYAGSGFNSDVFFINWVMKASPQNSLSQSVLQSRLNAFFPDRFNHVTPEQLKKWRGN